jgi:antitoxin (DNA-binding transcriptional repressor) of toxin-antitoxin stability system
VKKGCNWKWDSNNAAYFLGGGEALGVRRLDAAFNCFIEHQLTLKRRRQAAALQGALWAHSKYNVYALSPTSNCTREKINARFHAIIMIIWSGKLVILKRVMKQYNIASAKTHFSKLVKMALLGEKIIIAKGNKPLLQLLPIDQACPKRLPGSAKNEILEIALDFNNTPEEFKDYSQ